MSDANLSSHAPAEPANVAARALVFAYGAVVYAGFLAIFLYLIGFLMGFAVPKTIDDGINQLRQPIQGVQLKDLELGLVHFMGEMDCVYPWGNVERFRRRNHAIGRLLEIYLWLDKFEFAESESYSKLVNWSRYSTN